MTQIYITDKGIITPDTSVLREEVQQEYLGALGQDLSLAHNSPQGQLISAEIAARSGVIRQSAMLANQINPNQATGVFLRGIGELMGIDDTKSVRTVVLDCVITGAPNSLFPSGSRATNVSGAQFLSINDVMLDSTGRGVVTFQAEQPGPIDVGVNGLTPAQPVPGWSRVQNSNSGIAGSSRLTDYEYRIYRQQALANQSTNMARSVISKVSKLPGVRSVVVRENDESSARDVGGVMMEPNSIWVCVNDNGGLSTQIAATLLECKAPGCKWSQSTNDAGTKVQVNQIDPFSGQTYNIKFVRSVPRTVWVRAYVSNNNSMADLTTAAVDATLAYAEGKVNNQPGFVVSANVSPFEIGGAIFSEVPGTYVRLVEVSMDGTSWTTTTLALNAWERAVLPRGNITVMVEAS